MKKITPIVGLLIGFLCKSWTAVILFSLLWPIISVWQMIIEKDLKEKTGFPESSVSKRDGRPKNRRILFLLELIDTALPAIFLFLIKAVNQYSSTSRSYRRNAYYPSMLKNENEFLIFLLIIGAVIAVSVLFNDRFPKVYSKKSEGQTNSANQTNPENYVAKESMKTAPKPKTVIIDIVQTAKRCDTAWVKKDVQRKFEDEEYGLMRLLQDHTHEAYDIAAQNLYWYARQLKPGFSEIICFSAAECVVGHVLKGQCLKKMTNRKFYELVRMYLGVICFPLSEIKKEHATEDFKTLKQNYIAYQEHFDHSEEFKELMEKEMTPAAAANEKCALGFYFIHRICEIKLQHHIRVGAPDELLISR